MSDLHRAVQAEIAAHTPALPPSFDALKARKHRRDRRRTLAAVTASALAAAGIAFVPSALGGSSDPAPARVAAAGADEVFGFGIRAADADAAIAAGGGPAALERCLALPGLSHVGVLFSDPAQYSGRVTGRGNAEALTDCVEAVPGWGITLTPVADGQDTRTYTVRPSVKLVRNPRAEEERDACFALPGVRAVRQGESMPVIYKATVPLAESKAFEQCITSVVGLHVPELDQAEPESEAAGVRLVWTGVQVCRIEPDRSCLTLDGEVARQLDALVSLDTAQPADPGVIYDCIVEPRDYAIQFQHPSARTVPIVVPDACEPMRIGDGGAARVFEVSQEARDAVRLAHFNGTTSGSHADLSVTQQRFVETCLSGNLATAGDAPGYLGRTEDEANPPDSLNPEPPRVVGRDGQCLGREDDRRDSRVNLVVESGVVIWAGRF